MSNITVTGNEAQFNEKVTFLKDVDIRGTLFVPPLTELTLNKLTVPDIFGNPNTTFHNKVTFLDTVTFPNALSFTDLEIRDRLAVGVGGTVLVADSRLNPGKVGIGSTQPTELLDVGGRAKILDLELRNLLVTGISTFKGDVEFHGNSGVTSVFFDKSHNRLKFIDESKATFGTGNDLEISHTRSLKDQTDSNGDSIVDGRTSLIEESGSGGLIFKSNGGDGPGAYQFFDQSWQPLLKLHGGNNARAILFHNGTEKFRTTGIGVSVLGDLIVPDVGIRTSVVGLGTTFPANPAVITELNDASQGPLRLDITGSIAIGRNLYDSAGQHGENGMFLRRNVYGVRWVAVTPNEDQQGILIQDEGQEIPLAGVAQTFHTLNMVQGNSLGIGTDTLIPTAQAIPGTGIATITTFDLWGYLGSGNNASIYRMSKVGINNSNPTYQLDITGTLHATLEVQFDNTLTVEEHTELNKTLNVDGVATFQDNVTINADNKFFKIQTDANVDKFTVDTDNGNTNIRGTLDVGEATSLEKTLDVGGVANFNNNTDASSSTDGGSVTIDGGAAVAKKLYVGGNTDIGGTLDVTQATTLKSTLDVTEQSNFNKTDDATSSTSGGSVTIDGGAAVARRLFVGDNTKIEKDTQATSSSAVAALQVVGGAAIGKKLFVGGQTIIESQTSSTNKDTGALIVDGGVGVEENVNVGGNVRISKNESSTNKDTGALVVELGGVGIEENLNVGNNLDVDGHTELDDLNVTGVSTFGPGITTQTSTMFMEQSFTSGVATFKNTVDVDADIKDQNDGTGTSVAASLSADITNADYNSTTGIMEITIANHGFANGDSIQIPDGTITLSCNYKGVTISQSYPRSKDPNSGKWLVISNVTTSTFQVDVGDGGLAAGVTHNFVSASGGVLHSSGQYVEYDYRLASVGTGVSWRPSGVQTKRTIWVSKSGSDSNSGLLEGDAKATIGAAATIAVETDTIKVRPGVYVENNPIGLRTDVSVTGEDIRLVIIQSKNPLQNVFHVRRGCLIENLNFGGSNVGVSHDGAACVAFPPSSGSTTGYTAPGPATEGPSGRWRSPYIRNCTNFMTGSIGMKVDGNDATAATPGADLKSMVCDSFTQYNEAGIGVSLTNNAYAQLVSIFTINTDIGIFATSGAQCDLTNSNSSFGNFGLVAVGLGSTEFTGIVSNTDSTGTLIDSTVPDEQDSVVAAGVTDTTNTLRRPFDGQALYFKIKPSNYPDVNLQNLNSGALDAQGRITAPLQRLSSVRLIGNAQQLSGFSAIDPPDVLIRDNDNSVEPKGPQGIIAEATATVSPSGLLTGINVVAQGRNYLSGQNIIVDIEGETGIATAVMEPIYFTVESSTSNTAGITTITFNEFVSYELFKDDPFSLQRISRILTSSHSFEYVGTGTAINKSVPLQGAIPIKANEVVATDGAQIPFTSTDQKGNFDIGEGLQINQTTSTISGRDFSRSLQAEVTPLILALR